MTYEDRLDRLNWFSLSSSRRYLLCSFVFKCLYGLCQCETISDNVSVNPRQLELLTFRHLPSRTRALFHSPTRSFPRIWNSLPSHIKDSAVLDSLPEFLRALKQVFLSNTSINPLCFGCHFDHLSGGPLSIVCSVAIMLCAGLHTRG